MDVVQALELGCLGLVDGRQLLDHNYKEGTTSRSSDYGPVTVAALLPSAKWLA